MCFVLSVNEWNAFTWIFDWIKKIVHNNFAQWLYRGICVRQNEEKFRDRVSVYANACSQQYLNIQSSIENYFYLS